MRVQELAVAGPIESSPLNLVDRTTPTPGPGEVLIDVAACGVCRTDLQLVEGDLAARVLPIVPGHQVVGRVAAVGSEVDRFQIGDRAGLAWLGSACGTCERCAEGRENLCAQARFTGWDRDGGYADAVVADARYVFSIPPGFSDLEAAPLLCGGVIGYRSLRISGIEPGGRLGLYGFGASALLALQVATHWGCAVYVATRSETERGRALQMGAVWAGDYDERPPVPLDAAITFAPVGWVAVEALSSVRPGGIVAINAIHLDSMPAFSYDLLWLERSIRSVANFTRRDAEDFLAIAAEIPLVTVVDVVPLPRANEALQRLSVGAIRGAAVLTM